ncbi:hypothetical protein V2J09_005852 [Rumex salicifolius]
MGGPKPSSSLGKRWRPTGDQVTILRGLFKGGLTTPSGPQIQRITGQLKEYGKVESKNVFYWFQNHKAREKQKLANKLRLNNNNSNNNNVMYYFYLPTSQYQSGICPVFPPQAITLEKLDKEGSSSMNVTWLTTNSVDSSHHNHHHDNRQENHREGLRTLELFPTTPSSSSSLSSISIAN